MAVSSASAEPLVQFMMIGAQKSGTTSVAQQLAAHPELCIADGKEPQFFNEVTDWRSHLDEYHAHFRPSPGQKCGDCSTTYTFLPEFLGTADRVHAYNPRCQFIYIMRDPVERMISNYAHRAARGITSRSIQDDLRLDATYGNRSRYAVQLQPWIDRFGIDQFALLIFEEQIADPADGLARIATFLGVDPHGFPSGSEDVVVHRSTGGSHLDPRGQRLKSHPVVQRAVPFVPAALRRRFGSAFRIELEAKPTIDDDLRSALWDFVADDVARVESWLGRPIPAWQRPT